MCNGIKDWEFLSIVVLGLRTYFKENLKSSPAEMPYELTLRILGEFFF